MISISKYKQIIALIILSISSVISANTWAAVELPALELEFLSGDDAVTLTAGILSTLTLQGSATSVLQDISTSIDIPDVPFLLNTLITSSVANGSGGFTHFTAAGTLNIDNGNLLSAALSNVNLTSNAANEHSISADLTYIAGSIVPAGINTGRIEGFFTGPIAALNINYVSSGSEFLSAQVGQVFVPIPATVWLFGSSLLGLIGFRRNFKSNFI